MGNTPDQIKQISYGPCPRVLSKELSHRLVPDAFVVFVSVAFLVVVTSLQVDTEFAPWNVGILAQGSAAVQ